MVVVRSLRPSEDSVKEVAPGPRGEFGLIPCRLKKVSIAKTLPTDGIEPSTSTL
jgi:hypothetical protein